MDCPTVFREQSERFYSAAEGAFATMTAAVPKSPGRLSKSTEYLRGIMWQSCFTFMIYIEVQVFFQET